jgi:hypothetical protein
MTCTDKYSTPQTILHDRPASISPSLTLLLGHIEAYRKRAARRAAHWDKIIKQASDALSARNSPFERERRPIAPVAVYLPANHSDEPDALPKLSEDEERNLEAEIAAYEARGERSPEEWEDYRNWLSGEINHYERNRRAQNRMYKRAKRAKARRPALSLSNEQCSAIAAESQKRRDLLTAYLDSGRASAKLRAQGADRYVKVWTIKVSLIAMHGHASFAQIAFEASRWGLPMTKQGTRNALEVIQKLETAGIWDTDSGGVPK